MGQKGTYICILTLLPLFGFTGFILDDQTQRTNSKAPLDIPRTWDDEAIASLEVPLAEPSASPKQVPADYYYRMTVRPIYKSYPVYHPSKEPAEYMDRLRQQEPQVIWDDGGHRPSLKTEADWVKAGELVFDAPILYETDIARWRDAAWYKKTEPRLARDGRLPSFHYVIREKGKVELGTLSCADCHTRVMPDGTVVKGAQGNVFDGRGFADDLRSGRGGTLDDVRLFFRLMFAAPWLQPDPLASLGKMSLEELAIASETVPGVMGRHGTSPFHQVQIPDLIGVKDRRYLDHTGLVRHRDIGDVMRYAAVNQDTDMLALYGNFRPIEVIVGKLPDPAMGGRYSDEQLYALALYIYSLKPPPNPNKRTALAALGEKVFQSEGCAMCHTPPLYTSNKLTPAEGFKVPDDHLTRFEILLLSVGTDPTLTLKTRRGTGYYKVPSLKGVWYRGPFEHNGSVMTLEDWFDPRRLRDDYVPTGFKGYGVKTRAVKGHEFGLKLSADDTQALIAFLKTL